MNTAENSQYRPTYEEEQRLHLTIQAAEQFPAKSIAEFLRTYGDASANSEALGQDPAAMGKAIYKALSSEKLRANALRVLLQPHWEEPAQQIGCREALDALLAQFVALKLSLNTGFLTLETVCWYLQKIFEGKSLVEFVAQTAISRYLNDYNYFSVQHLAHALSGTKEGANSAAPERFEANPEAVTRFLQSAWQQNLSRDPDEKAVFRLLDDIVDGGKFSEVTQQNFRIWLRSNNDAQLLHPETIAVFQGYQAAIKRWVNRKADLYRGIDYRLQTRFALFDFYWLKKLLHVEVTPNGKVNTSLENSWIELAALKGERSLTDDANGLRLAWSAACQWLQGESLEPLYGRAAEQPNERPGPHLREDGEPDFRKVFADELEEILRYRTDRKPHNPELSEKDLLGKINTVKESLVGVALSGGGIRSATVGLGVLELLKKRGILRNVDYVSTVSGGGYIGAWLVANTYRGCEQQPTVDSAANHNITRRFWLSKGTDWNASIAHLRRYSNYLAPKVGIFSADAWSIYAIWSRNTILLQMLLFLTLAALLLLPYLATHLLQAELLWNGLGLIPIGFAVVMIGWSLRCLRPRNQSNTATDTKSGQGGVQWLVVLPMLLGSYFLTLAFWNLSACNSAAGEVWCQFDSYPAVFVHFYQNFSWSTSLLVVFLIGLSVCSVDRPLDGKSRLLAGCAAVVSSFGLYAMLSGVVWAVLGLRRLPEGSWYVAAFGPVLILASFTLSVILILGVTGRASSEAAREWWGRIGAWFMIYLTAWGFVSAAALFAPLWVANVSETWTLAGVGGWLATTAAGLLAGNSPKTKAAEQAPSRSVSAMEWVARIAPYIFVAGLVIAISVCLHAFLLFANGLWPPPGGYGHYYWATSNGVPAKFVLGVFVCLVAVVLVYQLLLDINTFSLSNFYQNRLVRCFLGAARDDRRAHSFINFDEEDDVELAKIRNRNEDEAVPVPYTGPFPIVNCALNLGGSSDLSLHTRHSASFTFTPLHAGSSRAEVGYASLLKDGNPYYCADGDKGLTLGQVITISGAAASPNMGFHTSTVVAFLLTVFNVRLGGWFPNPKRTVQKNPWLTLRPLASELFATAGEESKYLNLSDGGHFENLGVYELVRRRCEVIIAVDAECDPSLQFSSLGNLIRMCETDFGAQITIDISPIRKQGGDSSWSEKHSAIGKIQYNDGTWGYLIYLKSSMTGDEDSGILQYKSEHPAFPHETTADQFFSEDQFESYRMLGYSMAKSTFRKQLCDENSGSVTGIARALGKASIGRVPGKAETADHMALLEKLRQEVSADIGLQALGSEIFKGEQPSAKLEVHRDSAKEFYLCLRLLQSMECLYFDLDWEDGWWQPENRSMRKFFDRCAGTKAFAKAWHSARPTFGLRFNGFIARTYPIMHKWGSKP